MGSTGSLVHQLSPVDHLSPRVHVPKLLYFASDEEPDVLVKTFREGLAKSISALPILGGSVGLLPGAAQKGTLAIQAPFFKAEDILSVKDVRTKYDFKDIKSRHFPPDAVNGELFAAEVTANPKRVLHAQANLIRGGVVLVFAIHHCVVDETGIFDVVKLWSTFCRGADGSSLVKPEWTDRTPLMKGEGTGRLADHPEYNLLPEEKSATIESKPTEYISKASGTSSSAIFFFSDDSLARLKSSAEQKADGDWISTNDALCALVWSRVTKARRTIGMGDATYSMFNMIVNGRGRMEPPMSEEYMGNVVFVSKAISGLDTLTSSSDLADVASIIRKSVLEVDNKAIKDKVKAVASVDDIGRLAPGGYSSFGRNVGCTSWANQEYYSLDWGKALGGRIERVRWRKTISDGIFVIFPRISLEAGSGAGGSGLEVYIGLEKEPLELLRKDKVFNQYAEWRCS
ncbi:related to trichothecene 3-O-acetyltransferase [Phialocephala subalpina]|uniref:Related to trichothecene 3-O-acetyltransferase n=1 Tax=Phialocephala subalpina TaxID=576137 RepID=A0A1L7WP53_9HELO|nr:related to trichothecene 3-O-acetyltransferase [Phialocephala subalpina]